MRLFVRDASPNPTSRLTDPLFPELFRGIALTELMLKKWGLNHRHATSFT